MTPPRLSICVPSRNRQYYFQKTIEGLLKSPRSDVQFVLADNSDDPQVMCDFIARFAGDPRVVFLPAADRPLSMMENWERTLSRATGDWVSAIGDDDHCDPDLVDLLDNLEPAMPDLDAVGWLSIGFRWRDGETPPSNFSVPLNNRLTEVPRDMVFDRMFRWVDATYVPTSSFSVYHSAVSRRLMDRIREKAGGVYLEHPNVDYDMAMKVIMFGQRFVFSERPFSIMGSCPKSNSFALSSRAVLAERYAAFTAESRRDIDDDPEVSGFPFKALNGVAASVAITQEWAKKAYGLTVTDWEANFARACARDTELYRDREDFEATRRGYETVLARWHGGKYLRHFDPVYKFGDKVRVSTGFTEQTVFVSAERAGMETPAEIYGYAAAITCPPAQMRL